MRAPADMRTLIGIDAARLWRQISRRMRLTLISTRTAAMRSPISAHALYQPDVHHCQLALAAREPCAEDTARGLAVTRWLCVMIIADAHLNTDTEGVGLIMACA